MDSSIFNISSFLFMKFYGEFFRATACAVVTHLLCVVVGCIFSAIAGSVDPLNAIVFAEVLNIFTLTDTEEMERQAVIYGMLFLALGGAGFIAYIFEVEISVPYNVQLFIV